MVRALLAEGQVVWPCAVDPLELPAYDGDGRANGSVTGRYVATEVAGGWLYGWMAWSHRAGDAEPVAHAGAVGARRPRDLIVERAHPPRQLPRAS